MGEGARESVDRRDFDDFLDGARFGCLVSGLSCASGSQRASVRVWWRAAIHSGGNETDLERLGFLVDLARRVVAHDVDLVIDVHAHEVRTAFLLRLRAIPDRLVPICPLALDLFPRQRELILDIRVGHHHARVDVRVWHDRRVGAVFRCE